MKNIIAGMLAVTLISTAAFADNSKPAKKSKASCSKGQVTCSKVCPKKMSCPKTNNCADMPGCLRK